MANEFFEARFLFIALQGPSSRLFGFVCAHDQRGNGETTTEVVSLCVSRPRAILTAEWRFSKSGGLEEESSTRAWRGGLGVREEGG